MEIKKKEEFVGIMSKINFPLINTLIVSFTYQMTRENGFLFFFFFFSFCFLFTAAKYKDSRYLFRRHTVWDFRHTKQERSRNTRLKQWVFFPVSNWSWKFLNRDILRNYDPTHLLGRCKSHVFTESVIIHVLVHLNFHKLILKFNFIVI